MPAPSLGVTLADVAAHYDDLDHLYREFWGEHVHHGLWATPGATPDEATRRLIDVVVERACIENGDSVCDAGCGYGGTARVLARELGARVTALTISPAQHAYAVGVDPGVDNPKYLLRDWLENGLEAEAFDAVLAIESSEHMPNLHGFFAEAERVLRRGGRLVLCAWLTREAPRWWEQRWLVGPICREGRLRAMESVASLQTHAAAVGFIPEGAEDVTRQVKQTWPICLRRVVVGLLRSPAHRRFLLRYGGANRIFGLTMLRIWFAYEVGAMRYGILTFVKP